jgi:hypothetical protein
MRNGTVDERSGSTWPGSRARRTLLTAPAVISAGCASIVYKSKGRGNTPPQQFLVTSEPTGATLRLDGVVVGVTPAKIPVRRTGPLQTLSVALDGYDIHSMVLKRELSGAAYGNLLFGDAALNPMNGPNGLSDTGWSRREQVTCAFLFPAIGFGIDAFTGAALGVRSPVHVVLAATKPARAAAHAGPSQAPPLPSGRRR